MSGKPSASRKTDHRVRRTRDTLGDALVELMHEKPFAAITVQHVLDRANVGRSTFYTHYRDKNDLFLSDVEDFFDGMSKLLSRGGETSNRVAPVRELFAHISEWRLFYPALIASGKIRDVHEMGQEYFARAIDQRLSELPSARKMSLTNRRTVAHALAGSLLSLLLCWIGRGMIESPEEMDDTYHQLVWFGVSNSILSPTTSTDERHTEDLLAKAHSIT